MPRNHTSLLQLLTSLLGFDVSRLPQVEVPVHCSCSHVCNSKYIYIVSWPDIFSVNSLIMRSKLISLGALMVKKSN